MTAALKSVEERIVKACRDAERKNDDVELMAVSKGRDAAAIDQLIKNGVTLFGENRAQEVLEKWPPIRARCPQTRVHFIGHLQTNKVKDVYAACDGLHSLDRPELAQALRKAIAAQPREFDIYIQVNTGEEPQKGGVTPTHLPEFVRYCRVDMGLNIKGLMVLPPMGAPAALHFTLLHKLAAETGLQGLSMGMSDDFETAIRCRATLVRLGSILFN